MPFTPVWKLFPEAIPPEKPTLESIKLLSKLILLIKLSDAISSEFSYPPISGYGIGKLSLSMLSSQLNKKALRIKSELILSFFFFIKLKINN